VASIKRIRAAVSSAYRYWDFKNPFAKIAPRFTRSPRSDTCSSLTSDHSSATSKVASRAMALPSRFTRPMPSSRPRAGLMN
jgi:hypothetical protein